MIRDIFFNKNKQGEKVNNRTKEFAANINTKLIAGDIF